ncbi:8658_t:CDS:2 [Funneliformis geosporum]|nr:8658_t:CDS:2 [Funneliformis geosporum]
MQQCNNLGKSRGQMPILSLFYALILGIFIKEVNSFTPISRNAFSSVLAGDKLYFFGGNPNSISNQTFCLDVSQSFSSENPPWIETPSAVIPFASVFATVSFIESSSIIYLFGGFMYDPVTLVDSFQSFVHTFNTQTLKWDIPKTNGQIPTRRRNIEAVKDNFGKIYIFGAPIARNEYTATLLSNGVIVYIGGFNSNGKTMHINEIDLYDTKLDSWKVMVAKNINMIGSRYSHTAVLAPNDQIIICGGGFGPANNQVAPIIAILNTQTTPFEWTIPEVSSNIGEIPSLVFHNANLVANYMIVSFGNITQVDDSPMVRNPKIYLLDIRNYTWINKFDRIEQESKSNSTQPQTHSNSPNSPSKDLTSKKVAISVVSSIVATAFLIGIGALLYRWSKKRKDKTTLRISGNFGIENNE